MTQPTTLAELKQTEWASPARRQRTVKDEMRENLICLLENGSPLFPGIVGYEETVIPQLVNAILSRHNFILLGLRGQAKSRILRQLVTLDRKSTRLNSSHITISYAVFCLKKKKKKK